MNASAQPLSVPGSDLTAEQLHRILRVRTEIFVVEQECAYQEVDGPDLDVETKHVWYEDEAGIAAYLRILADGDRRRIGRVLTRIDRRGAGVSSKLMAAALDLIGSRVTVLEAQSYLVRFYSGFGFEVTGPEYIEDGIPHVPMRREVP